MRKLRRLKFKMQQKLIKSISKSKTIGSSWEKLKDVSKVYLLGIYRDILANEQLKKCQLLNNRDVYE